MNRLSITVLFLVASLAAATGCAAESESVDGTDSTDTNTETGVAMTKDPSRIHGADGDVSNSDIAETEQSALTVVTPNTVNPIILQDDDGNGDKRGPQPEPWHPSETLIVHAADQGHSK